MVFKNSQLEERNQTNHNKQAKYKLFKFSTYNSSHNISSQQITINIHKFMGKKLIFIYFINIITDSPASLYQKYSTELGAAA